MAKVRRPGADNLLDLIATGEAATIRVEHGLAPGAADRALAARHYEEGRVLPAIFVGPDDLAGPGQTGHAHPETSREAGRRDFANARAAILAAIEEAGADGLTARDLTDEGLAPSTNIAGSRLGELRGTTARFPDRLVGRVVHEDTGQLVKRDGCAVHVATSVTLPAGLAWETPATVRLCPTCGQGLPMRDDGEPVAE